MFNPSRKQVNIKLKFLSKWIKFKICIFKFVSVWRNGYYVNFSGEKFGNINF